MKGQKLTRQEFMDKFKERNEHFDDIEVLGEYVNAKTKIKCRCKVCGNEWETVATNLFNNHGCPKCKALKSSKGYSKTNEQFMAEIEHKLPHTEILSEYVNAKTKILCRCITCGNEWESYPSNLLKGHECFKCGAKYRGNNQRITHDDFLQRVSEINPNVIVLGKYTGCNNTILCKCKVCDYEWHPHASTIMTGVVVHIALVMFVELDIMMLLQYIHI